MMIFQQNDSVFTEHGGVQSSEPACVTAAELSVLSEADVHAYVASEETVHADAGADMAALADTILPEHVPLPLSRPDSPATCTEEGDQDISFQSDMLTPLAPHEVASSDAMSAGDDVWPALTESANEIPANAMHVCPSTDKSPVLEDASVDTQPGIEPNASQEERPDHLEQTDLACVTLLLTASSDAGSESELATSNDSVLSISLDDIVESSHALATSQPELPAYSDAGSEELVDRCGNPDAAECTDHAVSFDGTNDSTLDVMCESAITESLSPCNADVTVHSTNAFCENDDAADAAPVSNADRSLDCDSKAEVADTPNGAELLERLPAEESSDSGPASGSILDACESAVVDILPANETGNAVLTEETKLVDVDNTADDDNGSSLCCTTSATPESEPTLVKVEEATSVDTPCVLEEESTLLAEDATHASERAHNDTNMMADHASIDLPSAGVTAEDLDDLQVLQNADDTFVCPSSSQSADDPCDDQETANEARGIPADVALVFANVEDEEHTPTVSGELLLHEHTVAHEQTAVNDVDSMCMLGGGSYAYEITADDSYQENYPSELSALTATNEAEMVAESGDSLPPLPPKYGKHLEAPAAFSSEPAGHGQTAHFPSYYGSCGMVKTASWRSFMSESGASWCGSEDTVRGSEDSFSVPSRRVSSGKAAREEQLLRLRVATWNCRPLSPTILARVARFATDQVTLALLGTCRALYQSITGAKEDARWRHSYAAHYPATDDEKEWLRWCTLLFDQRRKAGLTYMSPISSHSVSAEEELNDDVQSHWYRIYQIRRQLELNWCHGHSVSHVIQLPEFAHEGLEFSTAQRQSTALAAPEQLISSEPDTLVEVLVANVWGAVVRVGCRYNDSVSNVGENAEYCETAAHDTRGESKHASMATANPVWRGDNYSMVTSEDDEQDVTAEQTSLQDVILPSTAHSDDDPEENPAEMLASDRADGGEDEGDTADIESDWEDRGGRTHRRRRSGLSASALRYTDTADLREADERAAQSIDAKTGCQHNSPMDRFYLIATLPCGSWPAYVPIPLPFTSSTAVDVDEAFLDRDVVVISYRPYVAESRSRHVSLGDIFGSSGDELDPIDILGDDMDLPDTDAMQPTTCIWRVRDLHATGAAIELPDIQAQELCDGWLLGTRFQPAELGGAVSRCIIDLISGINGMPRVHTLTGPMQACHLVSAPSQADDMWLLSGTSSKSQAQAKKHDGNAASDSTPATRQIRVFKCDIANAQVQYELIEITSSTAGALHGRQKQDTRTDFGCNPGLQQYSGGSVDDSSADVCDVNADLDYEKKAGSDRSIRILRKGQHQLMRAPSWLTGDMTCARSIGRQRTLIHPLYADPDQPTWLCVLNLAGHGRLQWERARPGVNDIRAVPGFDLIALHDDDGWALTGAYTGMDVAYAYARQFSRGGSMPHPPEAILGRLHWGESWYAPGNSDDVDSNSAQVRRLSDNAAAYELVDGVTGRRRGVFPLRPARGRRFWTSATQAIVWEAHAPGFLTLLDFGGV
ncbi:hypothetical protein THASP1DRAFT_33058 [Thamnocephalis sphaerospora]|uniref:Uncharacterized protein n=1 Tax=Thamnocephalis sphaerospora TaxID=78915 RepID=A0A4P9XHL4_9FUNG|nr:hypothetical protein THASP1DRAFT_33058 [Thamnocephalis sphaerospora]|eukprot:RKP05107.1 hypothetical protein THASP1DRAFT_33058 [Thamnocephalis sphaerospora]